MKEKRVAILGLGRSGLAIAKAVLAHGGHPVVYDRATRENIAKPESLEAVQALNIPVHLGWDNITIDPSQTDLIVTNPAVDMRAPIFRNARENGIEILSEVEFAYRISKAPIVAITGTNGKSTTTVMTYQCLKECGEDPILCGNIFGSGYEEVPLTEAALNATEDQILVAEISSFQLEWVSTFRPVSAGITNIWEDHLDRYDNFAQYAATKQRIFAAQGPGDFAVIRAHDPVVKNPNLPSGSSSRLRARYRGNQAQEGRGITVFTFGGAGEHASVETDSLRILDKTIPLNQFPFQEPHNRTNATMAALLAYGVLLYKARKDVQSDAADVLLSAEDAAIKARDAKRSVYSIRLNQEGLEAIPDCVIEGLKSFKGLAHRMEHLGAKNGVTVINNSMCTNPDAIIKSSMAINQPKHILIGGVNKGADFKPLRAYLQNSLNRAYLFGRDAHEINEMMGGVHPEFATMQEAFEAATKAAKNQETIMLAPGCASMDQFKDFRDRGDVFRKIAKEWLET